MFFKNWNREFSEAIWNIRFQPQNIFIHLYQIVQWMDLIQGTSKYLKYLVIYVITKILLKCPFSIPA